MQWGVDFPVAVAASPGYPLQHGFRCYPAQADGAGVLSGSANPLIDLKTTARMSDPFHR
jgi:hypothetical protein